MKTQVYLLACALVFSYATSGNAQINQGTFRIGGGVSYLHSKHKSDPGNNDQTYAELSLSPAVAYFPIDNFSVGISFPATFSAGDYFTGTTSTASYEVGPEVRYYFTAGQWAFFPSLAYTFGKTVYKVDYSDVLGDPPAMKTETSKRTFAAGAGTSYFISNNFAAEAILLYKSSNQEYDMDDLGAGKVNSINFSLGLQLYLRKN